MLRNWTPVWGLIRKSSIDVFFLTRFLLSQQLSTLLCGLSCIFSPHIEIFPAPSPFPPPLSQILGPQSLRSSRCPDPWSVFLTLYSPTVSRTVSGYRASLPKSPLCSSLHDPYRFVRTLPRNLGFPGGSVLKNPPAVRSSSIPGSGRSLAEGIGNPLQYSCLENPMDRRAWWAVVHGVSESNMTKWLSTVPRNAKWAVFFIYDVGKRLFIKKEALCFHHENIPTFMKGKVISWVSHK